MLREAQHDTGTADISIRAAALALSIVAIAFALTVARPHSTPGPVMRDFESYYAAGQTWTAHRNPYSTDIWAYEKSIPGVRSDRVELLPFVGAPAFLPFWAFFALFPFPVAALLWGAILIAAAAAVLIAALRSTNALSAGALLAGACVFTAFGPFTSDLALGQAALLSFAACVGATLWLIRSPILTGTWAFFAALQPNIALALLSQITDRRSWRPLLVAALCFLAFCFYARGWDGPLRYARDLLAHGRAERFVLIQMTPAAVAYGFGAPALLCQIIGGIAAAGAFIVALVVVRNPYLKTLWKLAAVCALLPFALPFFHEHDFVTVLLAVVLCALLAEHRTWSIAATGALFAGIDWLGLAQRPQGFAQASLLAIALLLALFAIAEQPLRRMLLPCSVLVALLGAGFLAQHHPAPIWPDQMRGAAALTGSTANIWHDELTRTGQFARDPLWAAMRLLTLTGAALLAWACIASARERDQLEIS
jgi:hypothetical protein